MHHFVSGAGEDQRTIEVVVALASFQRQQDQFEGIRIQVDIQEVSANTERYGVDFFGAVIDRITSA